MIYCEHLDSFTQDQLLCYINYMREKEDYCKRIRYEAYIYKPKVSKSKNIDSESCEAFFEHNCSHDTRKVLNILRNDEKFWHEQKGYENKRILAEQIYKEKFDINKNF